ncbi:hypothetical protein ACVWXN_006937 [Bradyrhizobium sp. i1.4.4]
MVKTGQQKRGTIDFNSESRFGLTSLPNDCPFGEDQTCGN